MQNPLDEHQASHTLKKVIPAEDYNRIRLAFHRIGNPLHIELHGMRCLDIILNNQYWLVMDRCMDDQWIMAWTDFQPTNRSAIHTPVNCMLRLYHMHAGLIMGDVIETLGSTLDQKLASL